MIKLQEKIKENHIKNLKKRIQNREVITTIQVKTSSPKNHYKI